MSLNTATDGVLSFKLEDVKFSYGPDRLEGIGVRDLWYDPWQWDVEVRLTPRIPPLPAGTLALVGGAVWRKSDVGGKWFNVAGFGCLGPSMTDAQIRAQGKPVIPGEWPSAEVRPCRGA